MEATMTQAPLRSDFLSVDEDMEISSEAGRGAESDIEIFDLDDDTATVTNDDEMIDDQEHDVKDEDMNEEFPRENTVDMDDEIVFDEDVEITEVEDTATASEIKDFALDAAQAQTKPQQTDTPVGNISSTTLDAHSTSGDAGDTAKDHPDQPSEMEHHTGPEQVDDTDDHTLLEQLDSTTAEAAEPTASSRLEDTEAADGEANTHEATEDEKALAALETSAATAELDSDTAIVNPATVLEVAQPDEEPKVLPDSVKESTAAAEASHDNHRDAEHHDVPDSVQEGVHEAGAAEVTLSSSPSHDIRVLYDGNDMSLFPPKDPQDTRTYMLQDAALQHSSVAELFPACRVVLGQSISDHDELLLEIPDLGLRLSEKSSHQPASTLSDVVDVYLALSYNDSSEEPGPLYLHLEVVPDFQSKLDKLHEMASDGKGFSSLIEPADSGEDEEDEVWDELAGDDATDIEPVVNSAAEPVTDLGGEHSEAEPAVKHDANEPAVTHDESEPALDNGKVEPVVEHGEVELVAEPEEVEPADELGEGEADGDADALASKADGTDYDAGEALGAGTEEISEEHIELDLHAVKGHEAAEAKKTADKIEESGANDDKHGEDEDDDFIDYSDDEDDVGTPVTPTVSHKRSWDEHAETEEEAAEGGEAKKAKASPP